MNTNSSAATYDACASFFDEAVKQGVRHAVISPGSRSTALTLTADVTKGLKTWVRIDERSAAFFALGLAKATGTPTVLVCTSGTAATNYLPAVVEAHYSNVPLLVLTADRPPELRDWGAGQTIDQRHLYGSHVRWFFEAPIASELASADHAARWWVSLAARAVSLCLGNAPGPVHINWPFREPLEPPPGWQELTELSAKRTSSSPADPTDPAGLASPVSPSNPVNLSNPVSPISPTNIAALASLVSEHPRGVVVAGPMQLVGGQTDGFTGVVTGEVTGGVIGGVIAQLSEAVARFCYKTGWPLLAEPTSQLRQAAPHEPINHFDLLLTTPWADDQPATAVVRIGGAPVSKPLRLWLEKHQPKHLLINPAGNWSDASFTAGTTISADPAAVLSTVADELTEQGHKPGRQAQAWASRWAMADAKAGEIIDHLAADALSQAVVVKTLKRHLPSDHTLFASNSMPVRSVNTYLRARAEPLAVHANSGASGIDGVISTAAGFAATGHPTTVLLGDLAFRHDLGGLAALNETGSLQANSQAGSLTVLVIDNGGGRIFESLPVASAISPDQFQRLFTTPTTPDTNRIAADLASAFGFEHYHVNDDDQLGELLANPTDGVRVITVPIDPEVDRALQAEIAAALAETLVAS